MNSATAHHALRESALQAFLQPEPRLKVDAVSRLQQAWQQHLVRLDADTDFATRQVLPGRPLKPDLVSPKAVGKRAMNTPEGRAVLIHALAHIEFNAINLALDAVWRFAAMPRDYYADWLQVAAEEAYHFTLLNDHLRTLGHDYGDFPAHNSLWEMAEKTSGNILARMALVPRTIEARGLDATPALRAKLAQAGDSEAAAILDIILRDEIGHVAIGNRWFHHLCEQRGMEPQAAYETLAKLYRAPALRGPFNIEARRAAGFSEPELARLTGISAA